LQSEGLFRGASQLSVCSPSPPRCARATQARARVARVCLLAASRREAIRRFGLMRARWMPVNVHLLSGQAMRIWRVRGASSARERERDRRRAGGHAKRRRRACARVCAHAHAGTDPRLGSSALRHAADAKRRISSPARPARRPPRGRQCADGSARQRAARSRGQPQPDSQRSPPLPGPRVER